MTARIYKPAKTAMQSGRHNTRQWLLEFEPRGGREADPLMGWCSSPDTDGQVRLRFPTQEEAIAFAKRRGIDYIIESPHGSKTKLKSYAENFRYDRIR
jgi:hypothetical protein